MGIKEQDKYTENHLLVLEKDGTPDRRTWEETGESGRGQVAMPTRNLLGCSGEFSITGGNQEMCSKRFSASGAG